jgi:hypothetical protein
MDLVSSIGHVFALCTRRNPFSRVVNITIADHLCYGCDDAEIELSGVVADGQVTMRINIEGYRSINGAGDGEIFLIQSSLGDTMATDSQIYLNDNWGRRFTDIVGVDNWSMVTDSDDQENTPAPGIRVDSRIVAAFPDGLVISPNRSVSQAEYITRHTQNNGPRPNARLSWLQTNVYDHITNLTGTIADDYIGPSFSSSTVVWTDATDPHEESATDPGRTNREVLFCEESEEFLV